MHGDDEAQLTTLGFVHGRLPTLTQDGVDKIAAGLTTPDEVERVAFLDNVPMETPVATGGHD